MDIKARLPVTMALLVGMVALALPGTGDARAVSAVPSSDDEGFSDFVQVDGIYYVINAWNGYPDAPGVGRPLEAADLGPVHARTRHQPDPSDEDPDAYLPQDGDAAYLPPGTPLYEVVGHAPWFRLAAHRAGGIVLYEAAANRQARVGGDLLDLAGDVEVEWIAVYGATARRELAAIREPAEVERLVDLVLAATVPQPTDRRLGWFDYYVGFHFADGTASVRAFSPGSNVLGYNVVVPEEFTAAIVEAVTADPGTPATPAASPIPSTFAPCCRAASAKAFTWANGQRWLRSTRHSAP